MRRPLSSLVILLFAGLWLAGCAATDRFATAEGLARPAGLEFRSIETGIHRIAAWQRMADAARPAMVYIEGDGLAWLGRHRPSRDPTPLNPLGLALAARDPSANVIYLARPCMYGGDGDPRCTTEVWTEHQFGMTAVEATGRALDRLKPPTQPVHLVGYSGGAAIAVALAARRADVVSLRSVAGNLDPAAVNRVHQVSPMPDALDIAGLAPRLASLPQRHFIGDEDRIVPGFVAQQFAARVGRCAMVTTVAARHDRGWIERWRDLLSLPLPCQ